MFSVKSNLLAMNASNHFHINDQRNKKNVEKLSSGYRINRAADDAAGLAISEKMRRQIRGLTQGTANAQDGVSFVQVADGAMNEVHDILQRMNELSIRSLNGTYTESDRAALNAELDQLRSEIDRISDDTQFNEQPVFDEHESSYHQIEGDKKWNDNQLHTVPITGNDLSFHLPKTYNPSDYTITVPAGVYTTQELVDEIDSALETMSPSNPGFVFEYSRDGICKVNFESAEGNPTEISSVDGSLSYLLYDSYNGDSSVSLIGTSALRSEFPLKIVRGQNDELGFYIEGPNHSNYISMTIPAGSYSRSEMIDLINQKLASEPDAVGVTAKPYKDNYVQISGGNGVSITGLKGNMFKVEETSPYYTSVFYDNVGYGNSSSTGGTAFSISGKAYYNSSATDKIHLTDGQNNVLCIQPNGAADYKEVTISPGDYTISDLTTALNEALKTAGLDGEVTASCSTNSSNYQYLVLTSKVVGTDSSLGFDISPNTTYAATYNALFRDTNYLPDRDNNSSKASFSGKANLSGGVKLTSSDSLTFNIDNKNYTFSGIAGSYSSSTELAARLNKYIDDHFATELKDKITFNGDSDRLSLTGGDGTNAIKSITVDSANQKDTYTKLFVGTYEYVNSPSFTTKSGSLSDGLGDTLIVRTEAIAWTTIPTDKASSQITITDSTNRLSFSFNGGTNKSITLPNGNYSNITSLVSAMNTQFANSSDPYLQEMKASYSGGRLTFAAIPPESASAGSYTVRPSTSNTSSSVWRAVLGTYTTTANPTVTEAEDSTLTTHDAVSLPVTVGSGNDSLTLTIGSTTTGTVTVAAGTYTTEDALKDAINKAITDNTDLNGKITAAFKDGKLVFSARGAITASGSFHDKVLITKESRDETTRNGAAASTYFNKAYIIGRKDLTEAPVEIISGANDTFTFDFTYTSSTATASGYKKQMDITIPEGIYTGDEAAAMLQQKIQEKFDAEGLTDFDIQVTVGGIKTPAVGANDDTALQIVVNNKNGSSPALGQYVVDGVRGSAASFLFYRTSDTPKETYITGTKDLSSGITFKPGQNVFNISADSVPYQYTFPEGSYTADEFAAMLNDLFTNGDDYGNVAPLKASIEDGKLKISHKAVGSHTISDIGGSARATIFLKESSRSYRTQINILVGAETEDLITIPRTRISSCSLGINSITISQPKYAEKAVARIKEAINLVSSRRSTYGSWQNRLEHTINNNNNVIENTQASESVIRDADISYEAMEHAKNNILLQANQAMLTQANQAPSLALSLLHA